MSLWQKIIYGEDLDALAAKDQQTDAQLRELNQGLVDKGVWTQQQLDDSNARFDAYDYNYGEQVNTTFSDTVTDQANQFRRAVDAFISGSIGTGLRLIPIWVWVFLAVFLAWKLGLFKRLLAKASA
jgi:hypothetical protein